MSMPKNIRQVAKTAELARWLASAELWPDPEASPDVPPREVLRQFLADPVSLADQDLSDQIRESVQCQRALDELRAEGDWLASMPVFDTSKPDYFRQRLETLRSAEPARPVASGPEAAVGGTALAAPAPTAEVPRAAFGQVWLTKSHVHVWTGTRFAQRWTFDPPLVLLVSEPVNYPCPVDLTVFRGVFCSPADDLPSHRMAEDEILVSVPERGEFVAHLWLNYPVADAHLESYLGEITAEDAENVQVALPAFAEGLPLTNEERAGLPLDPALDSETLRLRRQLHGRASYLSATVDAWTRMAEDSAITINKTRFDADVVTPWVDPRVPVLDRDDTGEARNRGLLWQGTLWDFRQSARTGGPLPGLVTFLARLVVPLQPRPTDRAACMGQWSLEWPEAKTASPLRGGERFFVLHPPRGRILGVGLVEPGGRQAVLKTGEWIEFERTPAEQLVLLIPAMA